MRTCVIILGMHRSGTSALAGVLHILGLNLGKDLLAGNEFNIKGYFENRKLYIIHERLLRSLNSGWHDDADLPLGWHVWPALDAYKEEIKQVLVGDFGSSDTFCLKDPRFAILLPLYVEIFNELMIDPCFIIMKRSIPEIMQSLNARDGLPEDRILALYSKYAACIETYTLGKKRITLSFDDLLNNTEKTIDVIKNGLGLQLKEYALVEKEVRGFLEHQLKHYHVTDVGYIQQLREE
ncbi:MAG: hypothetical protein KBA46_02005, partial [Candidatus Omnitrophica bacterium]|nr:hypothetical protein [Candidatus Omnitrophota bacterium]